MEQCNCCKCNRECNKSVENRCSCQKEKMPCQQVKPMRDYYRNEARYTREAYSCTDTANDEVGHMALAMAYVPWQQWGDVFTGECGLDRGTIFPELVKPFWVCCGQK